MAPAVLVALVPATSDSTVLMSPAFVVVAIVLVVIGLVIAFKGRRG